jgi:glycosyltransferase involved in cell wall biosynthesis
MTDICFITTCRGRLANLKQSLPTFVCQPNTSCVVVDYDCPEEAADWVADAFPQVRIVRVKGREHFEVARARNLGAEAAESPWLCFVDADVQLDARFADTVRPLLQTGRHFRPQPRLTETWGTCICQRDEFRRVEGYDDVLQGWGCEDDDFYARLQILGNEPASFPGELLKSIGHEPELRVVHYRVKNQWLSATANIIYCRMKWDLMRLAKQSLPRDQRQKLYQRVSQAIMDAHADGEPIELGLPLYEAMTPSCGPLDVKIVYRLRQPRRNGPAMSASEPA